MQNFSDTKQTKVRECFNVKNEELIYTRKVAYFEKQQYSTGEVVIISYEQDLFRGIRSVCFFKFDVFLISDILGIIQFKKHFNAYSGEAQDNFALKKLVTFWIAMHWVFMR